MILVTGGTFTLLEAMRAAAGITRIVYSFVCRLRVPARVAAVEHLAPGNCAAFDPGTGHGSSVLEGHRAACSVTDTQIPFVVADRRAGDVPVLADRAKQVLRWEPEYTDVLDPVGHCWNWLRAHRSGYEEVE